MEKNVILHLGLPKCGSTSLQTDFSMNEQIDYFGFNPEKNTKSFYRDHTIAEFFDKTARYTCKNYSYYKQYIKKLIITSKEKNIVFSSENLSLRFLSWDLPTNIKLDYIKKIFPPETKYLVLYRNPLNLLKSLYKEWLLLGYEKNYKEFVEEIYRYRDISFFNDICLGSFINLFSEYFNLDNLKLVFVDSKSQIDGLNNIIRSDFRKLKKNVSIKDIEAQIIYEQNQYNKDFCSMFDRIEMHRTFFNIENEYKYMNARKRKARIDSVKTIIKYFNYNDDFFKIDNKKILTYLIKDLNAAKKILNKDKKIVECLDIYMNSEGLKDVKNSNII